jgi:hypothetical protein
MHTSYSDIKSRIAEEPQWYDSNGVPRYDEFEVGACPDIYTDQVVLMRIACQACKREFKVEMHGDWWRPLDHPRNLHYGDPPAHDCVGDSMNCVDLEVLQAWRMADLRWERVHGTEGAIDTL